MGVSCTGKVLLFFKFNLFVYDFEKKHMQFLIFI